MKVFHLMHLITQLQRDLNHYPRQIAPRLQRNYWLEGTEKITIQHEIESIQRDHRKAGNRFSKGRKVARQPATMPAPGSIVDQMAILVAFPNIRQTPKSIIKTITT